MANSQRQNNQRPDKSLNDEERGPRQRRGGQRDRGSHIGNPAGMGEGFSFFKPAMKEQMATAHTVDFSSGNAVVKPGMATTIVVEMQIAPKSGASRRVRSLPVNLLSTGAWKDNVELGAQGQITAVKAHPAHHTSMAGLPIPVGGKIRVERLFDVTREGGQERKERRPSDKMVKSDKVLAIIHLMGAEGRIRSARSNQQIRAEVFSDLNFSEINRRKDASATGRGGISPVLFQQAQVTERSFDSRYSGASMGMPTHQQQQQTRLQAMLAGLGASATVLSAANTGGLEGVRALWAEDAEAANWAHRVGFLKADEAGALEFPDVTVVQGLMFLWLPDGASVEDIGFEIGQYRVRLTANGSVVVDKPEDLVEAFQQEWKALLDKCDTEYAAEQKARRAETLRRNSKTGSALGTDQLSFS